MAGPLQGLRVVELAGIGPGPHAAMILADLGADVVRVERPGGPGGRRPSGSQTCCATGARSPPTSRPDDGRELVLRLIGKADVLIEGFRPGVTERLGLGPDDCHGVNPRLVYAPDDRLGPGRPARQQAGHDINYISLTGVLHAIGRAGRAPGAAAEPGRRLRRRLDVPARRHPRGAVERQSSGKGQVVDAAMVDGSSVLSQMIWAFRGHRHVVATSAASNMLDGGAPYYDTYECSDGKLHGGRRDRAAVLRRAARGPRPGRRDLPGQNDVGRWPELRARFTEVFACRDRDDWAKVFDGTDACVTPVLSFAEVETEPHITERDTFYRDGDVL